MYLRIRDIFALAADYQPDAAQTQQFFQIIQNKLHWAAHGKTAAELIAERADHTEHNMGLTAWKGGDPQDRRYHRQKLPPRNEIAELNRIVTMYLDYAEEQARAARFFTCATGGRNSMPSSNSTSATSSPMRGASKKPSPTNLRNINTTSFKPASSPPNRDDAKVFDEAVKKLPAKKPRRKKS